MVKILPSLLASDFTRLGQEIEDMETAGADIFHLDIMDGQFVPNISFGLPVVKAISEHASIPVDVHLMTNQPEQFIPEFKEMEVDMVSFHIEATQHPHRVMQLIQKNGMRAGIALNPHTPVQSIKHLLPEIDFVLIMTVNPGFGGQSFIGSCADKIGELNDMRSSGRFDFDIEVDGGIDHETAAICRRRGADLFVSGSYLFQSVNPRQAILEMKG
ncbi:ribulose-phosphate 3-epimerase [Salinicoccus albus]|uniref:ribulose-phosphate 3-epimerase n=1 Tax=Salinicoccus albus TaxID=418756 RepID=UPI000369F1D5|nr:ribulose-phosphate 3-epimerase [Salinicoccus albus]